MIKGDIMASRKSAQRRKRDRQREALNPKLKENR